MRLARVVWAIWPAASWTFPAIAVLALATSMPGAFQFAMMGGLGAVVLLGVPVIIVVLALLGELPRRSLLRRGASGIPGPMLPPLLLHWGFIIAGLLTYASDPEMGGSASILTMTTGHDFGDATGWWYFASAFVAWTVVLMMLFAEDRPISRVWQVLGYAALAVVPIALVATPPLSAMAAEAEAAEQGQLLDESGGTAADAFSKSQEEQIALFRERYTSAQQKLATVRTVIGQDDWLYRGNVYGTYSSVIRANSGGMSPWEKAPCVHAQLECYAFSLHFRHAGSLDEAAQRTLLEYLKGEGWSDVDDKAPRTGASGDSWGWTTTSVEGYRVHIGAANGLVNVSLDTRAWWGEGETMLRSLVHTDPAPSDSGRYWSAHEWPAIDEE